ncbi:protein MRG2-like [Juglans microcarpa x Juglans regia]|uniref:protein MRG2-like n=1 Tax=Juglans microcarpa x Juglans regia TaxID=2249226 RepID=UPI001B7E1099|nr:protein MRG2-like [Juglans microcarpa x Juglans regia]
MEKQSQVVVFGIWASSYCKRVEIALALKDIPYEYDEAFQEVVAVIFSPETNPTFWSWVTALKNHPLMKRMLPPHDKLVAKRRQNKQYHEAVVDNVSPSTIYGAEHLLRLFGRLFVKLPELLAYVNIEEETLTCLQQKLLDFLKMCRISVRSLEVLLAGIIL